MITESFKWIRFFFLSRWIILLAIIFFSGATVWRGRDYIAHVPWNMITPTYVFINLLYTCIIYRYLDEPRHAQTSFIGRFVWEEQKLLTTFTQNAIDWCLRNRHIPTILYYTILQGESKSVIITYNFSIINLKKWDFLFF